MRIVELAPYAYLDGHKEFDKTSGAAFAITDICTALAEDNDVYLLTQSAITNGTNYKGITVLKRGWLDIIFHSRLKFLKDGMRAIKGLDSSLVYKLKVVLYFMSQGYTEYVLNKIKPEIVHIESIGYYTIPYMLACLDCRIPFVITNHGLVSFAGPERIDSKQKKLEADLFELAEENNVAITCVSSGIIKRLKAAFNISGNNVYVVGNCIGEFEESNESEAIKSRFGILDHDKVVLCLGSISIRKNQLQVLRAYMRLPSEIRKSTVLIFLGDGPLGATLQDEISKCSGERIYFAGFIEHKKLSSFYAIANINITASVDEGFGLPIIEAFKFGLPTVTFRDLDAIEDLYFPEGFYLAEERSDSALSNSLEMALSHTEDNSEIIKEKSKLYSKERMAEQYCDVFRKTISKNSTLTYAKLRNLL